MPFHHAVTSICMPSGGPSSKWRCKECGQRYGHNPAECDVCGHTIFQPLDIDDVEDFDGGEATTDLDTDVSELVDRANPDQTASTAGAGDTDDDEQTTTQDEQNSDDSESGLFRRLVPWLWPHPIRRTCPALPVCLTPDASSWLWPSSVSCSPRAAAS
jgi:hypothetical protein